MTSPHTLTILRSAGGKPQAKRHVRLPTGTITSTKIATETWWSYSTREAATLDELARVLRELADDELAILLRDQAKPAELEKPLHIRRLARNFDDVPRAWLMIDVDDLVAPHLDVVDEPELAAHFIRDELATYAPELEGVAMLVAWSGSCGIRDRSTLKAHVVVMLDRTATSGELRRWAQAVNARAPGGRLVDESLYHRIHIHYTARPICVGFPDPFPGDRRFVKLSGAPTTTLDVPTHNAPRVGRVAGDAPLGDVRGFDARLARIGAAGVHNETMAAIGAVVRALGAARADASRASILARVEARIRETRDPERADHHIAQLDGMFSRVLDRQRAHDEEATRATPTYPPRGVPLDVAMQRTRDAVGGFMRIARDRKAQLVADGQERKLAAKLAKAAGEIPVEVPPLELPPPPVHAIRVDAGTGKTSAFVEVAAEMLREGVAEHRLRVAFLVPLRRLGDQIVDDLRAAGVSAQLWRGLMADDPDEPGAKMCREPELAKAALALGALDAACQVCPSFASCAYQRQKERPRADVEVAAHNFLFAEASAPAGLQSCDVVVVDEGFAAHAIEGAGEDEDEPTKLLLSTLDGEPTGFKSVEEAADLAALRAKLKRALLRAIEAGELRREMLLDEGLTLDEITEARALEWRRKPKVTLEGGAPVADMIDRLATIRRESSFTTALPGLWSAIRRWLSTGVAVAGAIEPLRELKVGRAGSGPGVRFSRRRDVASWAQGMPILAMDATMPVPVVRELLPRVEVVADIEVTRPTWVRHHQLVEALPVSALVEVDASGAVRAKAKLRDVADRVEVLARQAHGQGRDGCDVLVGSTIDVEGALRELLLARGLDVAPATGATRRHAIELAHFGAVEGSNAFAGVRHVVVVSWPLPPAGAMERQARALTGAVPPGEVGAGAWPMAPVGIALRDGSGYGIEAPRHPDQLVEAMRWAATEGRMVQLADRARGVRRGAEAPLDVWILSPLPLPGMPADRLLAWADVEVDRLELAFRRLGGVLPLRPLDLVRTGLWGTEKAAERSLEATGVRQDPPSPLESSLLKATGGLESTGYRRPGQSAWSTALVAPALPAARVVELLRAATGEPELIVALGGAPPPDRPRGSFDSSTRARATPPAPAAVPPPLEKGGETPAPRVEAATPVPARGRALGAASIFCPVNRTSEKRSRGVELPVEPDTIRTELRRRGMTLDTLARRARVSRPHLSNAMAGRFRLSQEAAARVFDELLALPPPPDDLLSWRAPGAS
jgi:hypothetical protein